MKKKTSVTLSEDVLSQVDRLAGSKQSRSAFIERVLRKYLRDQHKAALHARDLARINRAAEQLNREAADVLDFQASDFSAPED
ncbi:MAG: ribbon-helix-helix domain-containing protein [Candidatus Acidiferrum sp.]